MHTIRKWQGKHEKELNELKELTYDNIYNKAVNLFRKGRIGIPLHSAAIKAIGIDDTKALYVEQYVYYLNGYTIKVCTNAIKQYVRKEILNKNNKKLQDVYFKEYISLRELYDSIPFEGLMYAVCKMVIDGWTDLQIRYILNITVKKLRSIYIEMQKYGLEHGYCDRRQYLIGLIRLRYNVRCG